MPTKEKGTYILILKAIKFETFDVGNLGLFGLEPKQYLYVGSAFGSGGLGARLKHHLKIAKKPHWHIDYLRQHTNIRTILYSTKPEGLEHIWANKLYASSLFSIPVKRFGASDCSCNSHLFSAAKSTSPKEIMEILDEKNQINIKVFVPQPKS